MAELTFVASFVVAAVLPLILFAVWVRQAEIQDHEPWSQVLKAFAWGATGGVLIGVALSLLLAGARPQAVETAGVTALYLAVIVAPLTEEFAKVYGLRWVEDDHLERQDGLIYGAAAGLGFAATENLAYGFAAFAQGGVEGLVLTTVARTLSTALLHATTSAVIGYAIWSRRMGIMGASGVVAAYFVSVAIHGAFNLAASITGSLIVLAIPFFIGIYGFNWVRRRVRELDSQPSAHPPTEAWDR